MRSEKLNRMTKGWFVGDFSPTLYPTREVEVAVKHYSAGAYEAWHYHKIATELTVIVSGAVEMNGQRFGAGEVVLIAPGEGTDFRALEDTVTTVVKLPCVPDDKFSG